MCCFTGPVREVGKTKIFGRLDGDSQIIVYSMEFSADKDVAMVLPIPSTLKGEDRVKFINMEKCPDFFDDLKKGFPEPKYRGFAAAAGGGSRGIPLEVHDVGAYEASFVPNRARFADLDPRFRLPETVWSSLPNHLTFGFVVFKLKAGQGNKVHPMAFSFKRRLTKQNDIFFPTLHIHDGRVHEKEGFDHILFYQCERPSFKGIDGDEGTPHPAYSFIDKDKYPAGVVNREQHVFRRRLSGYRKNEDTVISIPNSW